MTRKCNIHRLLTNLRYREEETHSTDSHKLSKATGSIFLSKLIAKLETCADPERFAGVGPTLTTFLFFLFFGFFLVDERREDPKGTKIGPSLAGVSLACR